MNYLNREAHIQNFIRRVNGDASVAHQFQLDPLAAVRTAGFDTDAYRPAGIYMVTVPDCLDPPETNHYRNK